MNERNLAKNALFQGCNNLRNNTPKNHGLKMIKAAFYASAPKVSPKNMPTMTPTDTLTLSSIPSLSLTEEICHAIEDKGSVNDKVIFFLATLCLPVLLFRQCILPGLF
jgi:hypothetical protein